MKSEIESAIAEALKRDQTIDISTLGRKSGQWRRIEIWFHYLNGRVFITAIPRPRGWYANLLANPRFQFHFKESLQRDVQATATPILDPAERRAILGSPMFDWYHQRSASKAAFIAEAPLVEVTFSTSP